MQAAQGTIKQYYKNFIQEYEQPQILTNTSNGTEVEIKFEINAGSNTGNMWEAFYPNTGIFSVYRNELVFTGYIGFKFKNPMKFSSFSFSLNDVGSATGHLYNGYMYLGNYWGSTDTQLAYVAKVNEGTSYTLDFSDNTTYSNYYTFVFSNGGVSGNDQVKIYNMRFYGSCNKIVEATADDYDFCAEHLQPKLVLDNGIYKAIRR